MTHQQMGFPCVEFFSNGSYKSGSFKDGDLNNPVFELEGTYSISGNIVTYNGGKTMLITKLSGNEMILNEALDEGETKISIDYYFFKVR